MFSQSHNQVLNSVNTGIIYAYIYFIFLGQVFAYGEYNVNYVAFDAENNTASCTFKIFVLRK